MSSPAGERTAPFEPPSAGERGAPPHLCSSASAAPLPSFVCRRARRPSTPPLSAECATHHASSVRRRAHRPSQVGPAGEHAAPPRLRLPASTSPLPGFVRRRARAVPPRLRLYCPPCLSSSPWPTVLHPFRDPDLGLVITYSPWQWTETGKMTKIRFHLFAHPNRKLNWIYFNDSKRQCKAIQTTEFEFGPMQYHNGFDI
jgi:hypothetical protein